ncbi:MAG: hypothetical protein P4L43_14480 [Syntrophobacteraceae bacterium]|nr:hypothetical protein [Syntrophobacteraceae bacterium]
MSISGIASATSAYTQGTASDGDSAAVEAKESTATKLAEQSGKSGSTSGSSQSSSNDTLTKIKMYANQHMAPADIAQRLGLSVATVVQEASAAGVNLNSGSSSAPPPSTNPAVGKNVDTTA